MDMRGIEGIRELREATLRDASPDELREIAIRVAPELSDDLIIANLIKTRELLEKIKVALVLGVVSKAHARADIDRVKAVVEVLLDEIEGRVGIKEEDLLEPVEVV